MFEEMKELSADQRNVIQVVVSLPLAAGDLPRPYTLRLIAGIAGMSMRRVKGALRGLHLLEILSDHPEEALKQADALYPLVWKPFEI
jgi:hypothetical protein